jgi:hypothetical protein
LFSGVLPFKFEMFKQERMEGLYLTETERQGRLVERITVIVDLSGLGMKHLSTPAIQTLRKIAAFGEGSPSSFFFFFIELLCFLNLLLFYYYYQTANYPERLKRCFIINGPSIFPRIWNLVKNFFDPRTQKKIFILGANYYEELVKYIPEDNIPAYLGGKSTIDGDIYCKADIPAGGPVPEYLFANCTGDDDDGEKKIVIKAGYFHVHSYDGMILFSLSLSLCLSSSNSRL